MFKKRFHFPSPLNIRGGPAFVPGGRSLNIYGVYYTVAPNPVSYNTLQYLTIPYSILTMESTYYAIVPNPTQRWGCYKNLHENSTKSL